MRVQQPVRDRNMSLWQSAVRQTLANRNDLSDQDKKQAEYGVSLHAQSAQPGAKPLAAPAALCTFGLTTRELAGQGRKSRLASRPTTPSTGVIQPTAATTIARAASPAGMGRIGYT